MARQYNWKTGCDVEATLSVIGGRWKPVLVCHLLSGRKRFGELKRLVPNATERMSGTQAYTVGIIDELAGSREELETLCDTVTQRLASGGANAIAATKRLLTEIDGSGDGTLAARGADLSASVLATPEARERLAAMFQRS